MPEYSETYGIKNIGGKHIRDALNIFFAGKKNLRQHVLDGKCYVYDYEDEIEEFGSIPLHAEAEVSDKDDSLVSIKISSPSDNITNYDLEHYCLRLYRYFTGFHEETAGSMDAFKDYCIRVYKKILHVTGFEGSYSIKFLSHKILFRPLFSEKTKNYPVERIIAFDCYVNALSLESARSQAISITNQLSAILSALLGTGFSDINTEYTHIIRRVGEGLSGELQQAAFMDTTLGEGKELVVKDNMNGLIRAEKYFCDDGAYNQPYFFSVRLEDENHSTAGTVISNNIRGMDSDLEDVFLGRKAEEGKMTPPEFYSDKIAEHTDISTPLKIPRCIRGYLKKVSEIYSDDSKKYQRLLGSCTLFNMAMIHGIYEPTLMISLMVSSIEALAKIEGLSFQPFMEKYLEGDYDKKFCDFLYGSMRSGFFHSGETYFMEYDCSLDISLNSAFERRSKNFHKAQRILRKAFISWTENNLLEQKKYPPQP